MITKETEFVHAGLQCWTIVARDHKNGYVAVGKEHPLFGKQYDALDVSVHGGLTYSNKQGDLWVFGFDTAHLYDCWDDLLTSHRMSELLLIFGGDRCRKWTDERLRAEVESLAEQLATECSK
jgi:hypothetical protein